MDARSVCVIGAGTMGSGIAAHLANIGFDVTLLDLTEESVRAAFDRAKAAKPPHFHIPQNAQKVRLGSVADNLAWAAEADWVCEAIVEKADLKRDLFEKLDAMIPESSMISTNTSGLEICLLAEGRSNSFRRRFVGTHFFNPPRYLKLLELIPTDGSDPAAVAAISEFLEEKVARRVVPAKDTPGFIANRFGMWSMFHAIHVAEKLRLSIEQVDAICGPFLGRPRSAAFRLNDIVGLDIMADIAKNLIERCNHDPHTTELATPQSMADLLGRGHLGAKTNAGYYKKEGRELLAYEFQTQAYRQIQDVRIPSLEVNAKEPFGERIANVLEARDEAGEFLRMHLVPVLQYANYLKEEISHSVLDFDRVMQWGFAWQHGPFEMIDLIGPEKIGVHDGPFYRDGQMRTFAGTFVPLPAEPQYAPIKTFPVVDTGDGFQIRSLADGVHAISLTTKMGTVNPALIKSLGGYLQGKEHERFVLTGESSHFSLGFDLNVFAELIDAGDWDGIEAHLAELQNLTIQMSRCRIVAAIHGYCLGAGAELALGCAQVVVHPEAMFGLPESKVGLIPGGSGTARLANLAQSGGAKGVVDVCTRVSQGFTSSNGEEARAAGFLRATDVVCYHPDRVLFEAAQRAKSVEPTALPEWSIPVGPVAGMIDKEQDNLKAKGDFSSHDELIADKVKHVFTKPASFEDALKWERSGFVELCKQGLTLARIRHMLESSKPLRN